MKSFFNTLDNDDKYIEKDRIKLDTILSYSLFLNAWEHLIQGIKSMINRDHNMGGKLP